MNTSTSITLSRPVLVDGTPVSSLTLREPTVADQERAESSTGGNASKEIALFSTLCDVPPEAIRALPLRDYKKLTKAYQDFLD